MVWWKAKKPAAWGCLGDVAKALHKRGNQFGLFACWSKRSEDKSGLSCQISGNEVNNFFSPRGSFRQEET